MRIKTNLKNKPINRQILKMNRISIKLAGITAAAMVIAMAPACSDELYDAANPAANTRIVATIDNGVVSRSSVDPENYTSGDVGMLWDPNDSIGVVTSVSANVPFANESASSVKNTVFAGTLQSGETVTYAYYPYDRRNADASATALRGTLPAGQRWDASHSIEGDFKYGTPANVSDDGIRMSFTHLFALIRFEINAAGTPLNGQRLQSITVSSENRTLAGEFTADITRSPATATFTEASRDVTLRLLQQPELTSSVTRAYMSVAPTVKAGEKLHITLSTDRKDASLDVEATADFVANGILNFKLTLSEFADEAHGWTVSDRPALTTLAIRTADNAGKMATRQLVHGSAAGVIDSRTLSEVSIAFDENDSAELTLPWLTDRSLVTRFETAAGNAVTVGGAPLTSGETAVDFTRPVVFSVSNGVTTRDYTVSLSGTGLPVVVINSPDGGVEWEQTGLSIWAKNADKTAAKCSEVSIFNADGTPDGSNTAMQNCTVRLRGNSSQNFPKKPFALKLSKKSSVLGMPANKDWVLLANWKDRTMMCNHVAFEAARAIGHATGSNAWQPRGQFVEVVYNGVHIGNYYLCEQIKIGGSRLAIRDEYDPDVAFTSVNDYGYLIELDDNYDEDGRFTSHFNLPYMFKDDVDAEGRIIDHIKAKVQTVETNLWQAYQNRNSASASSPYFNAAYAQLDLPSIVDSWLLYQLTMNDEYGHPKSFYLYVDGDSKIFGGPVWDFDWLSFPTIDRIPTVQAMTGGSMAYPHTYSSTLEAGYAATARYHYSAWPQATAQSHKSDRPFFYYPILFYDTQPGGFRDAVMTRWAAAEGALRAFAPEILEIGASLEKSAAANDAIWAISPNELRASVDYLYQGFRGDEDMTFREAYNALYQAFVKRLDGMSSLISSGSYPSITNYTAR